MVNSNVPSLPPPPAHQLSPNAQIAMDQIRFTFNRGLLVNEQEDESPVRLVVLADELTDLVGLARLLPLEGVLDDWADACVAALSTLEDMLRDKAEGLRGM
jgi:hypothetical protein